MDDLARVLQKALYYVRAFGLGHRLVVRVKSGSSLRPDVSPALARPKGSYIERRPQKQNSIHSL
jgi:hypothetical protein